MKKKLIITSVLTIVVCLSLITGATFAYFTDSADVSIAATAAKVDVEGIVNETSLNLFSLDVAQQTTFENGGTAEFVGSKLELKLMTPGDKVKFNIGVTDNSNVKIKYRLKAVFTYAAGEANEAFAKGLVVSTEIGGVTYSLTAANNVSSYFTVDADTFTIPVSVELPSSVGNDAQEGIASVQFILEAVQGNGEYDLP